MVFCSKTLAGRLRGSGGFTNPSRAFNEELGLFLLTVNSIAVFLLEVASKSLNCGVTREVRVDAVLVFLAGLGGMSVSVRCRRGLLLCGFLGGTIYDHVYPINL